MSSNLANPIIDTATLTTAQAAKLSAGKWSGNLHTAARPNGEVRDQDVVRP